MTSAPPTTVALGADPGFIVQLDAFNGPLDLLLHLLREASITEVASHSETLLGIPERNIETMRRRARPS